MVVRADVLATPALLFESDRKKIHLRHRSDPARRRSAESAGSPRFRAQAQKVQAQRPGEIVFVGAGSHPRPTKPRV